MAANSLKLLLLPGDGIGPELAAATARVLDALDRGHGLGIALDTAEIGLAALADRGTTFPDAVARRVREADGVILGPCDTYAYPAADKGGINPSAAIRKGLELYANIRPSASRAGVAGAAPGVDLVVVRENLEGFYADRNMFMGPGELMPVEGVALAVRKITSQGSRRIARVACALAMERRKRLTIVTKANVMKLTDGLFRREAEDVAASFPGLAVEHVLVDAMASALLRHPESFDVVVTTNMFGDILSNLAAEVTGGLGLAGSLNAGDAHAVAQASHGSAPDIAGKDVANPVSLLLSTAMLLRWLGKRRGRAELAVAAGALEGAIDRQIARPGGGTADIGGCLGTRDFIAAVIAGLAGMPA